MLTWGESLTENCREKITFQQEGKRRIKNEERRSVLYVGAFRKSKGVESVKRS
jgi:hypothetical protein